MAEKVAANMVADMTEAKAGAVKKSSLLEQSKGIFNRFMDGFTKHDLMTLAAALAFYTALSLAPLVLLIVAIVGIIGSGAQAEFLKQVHSLMGTQAAEALDLIIKNANANESKSSVAGIFGTLVLLFSASAVFAQLQSSMNVIWEAQGKASEAGWITYLRVRFFSMGMVIALGFLALVSLLVSTILSAIFTQQGFFWDALSALTSLLTFSGIFALVFKYLPDREIEWRHVALGGVITGILFTIGRSVIGIYLGTSAIGSAYGAAGSLIVLLSWVYYSAVIVFVGAELTHAVFHHEKSQSENFVKTSGNHESLSEVSATR